MEAKLASQVAPPGFFLLLDSMDLRIRPEVQSCLAVWLGCLGEDHGDVLKCINGMLIFSSQWLGMNKV